MTYRERPTGVPGVESQLKLKIAAYGDGFPTAGGMRSMVLCSQGQGSVRLALLRCACNGL